jgi:hypothetical protein
LKKPQEEQPDPVVTGDRRLRLARWIIKASICLAIIGRRLYHLWRSADCEEGIGASAHPISFFIFPSGCGGLDDRWKSI